MYDALQPSVCGFTKADTMLIVIISSLFNCANCGVASFGGRGRKLEPIDKSKIKPVSLLYLFGT